MYLLTEWEGSTGKYLEQNLKCKFYTVDLFFFTVTLSCNKFR